MGTINIDRQIETAQEKLKQIFQSKEKAIQDLKEAEWGTDWNSKPITLLRKSELGAVVSITLREYEKQQKLIKRLKEEKAEQERTKPDTVSGFIFEKTMSLRPQSVIRKANLKKRKIFNKTVKIVEAKLKKSRKKQEAKLLQKIEHTMDVYGLSLEKAKKSVAFQYKEAQEVKDENLKLFVTHIQMDDALKKAFHKHRRNMMLIGMVATAGGAALFSILDLGTELIEELSSMNIENNIEVMEAIADRDTSWYNLPGHGVDWWDGFMEQVKFDAAADQLQTADDILESDAYVYTTNGLTAGTIAAQGAGAAAFHKAADHYDSNIDENIGESINES